MTAEAGKAYRAPARRRAAVPSAQRLDLDDPCAQWRRDRSALASRLLPLLDMLRILALATALMLATASLGAASAAAQTKSVESTIKAVDAASGTVTLADGTKLVIPKTLMVPRGQLKPGVGINANYEERGGEKVATSLQIKG